MKEYFDILRKCPLFFDISDGDIGGMLGCLGTFVKEYAKGEMIVAEGDRARYIGVLLSGEVHIEQTDYYGNRSLVARVEPSEMFGETFACADAHSIPVDVVAAEASSVMFFEASCVTRTCGKTCLHHQQIIYNLMRIMANKNLVFHQKITVTSKRTTREKLMAYLMLQSRRHGKNSFEIPFDRRELADYLEVDRSGLSAEISKLRKEGIIECSKSRFTLL